MRKSTELALMIAKLNDRPPRTRSDNAGDRHLYWTDLTSRQDTGRQRAPAYGEGDHRDDRHERGHSTGRARAAGARTFVARAVPVRTEVWGYNRIFPARRSSRVVERITVVTHRSELPVPVLVHLHGGKTPPEHDGLARQLQSRRVALGPGQCSRLAGNDVRRFECELHPPQSEGQPGPRHPPMSAPRRAGPCRLRSGGPWRTPRCRPAIDVGRTTPSARRLPRHPRTLRSPSARP